MHIENYIQTLLEYNAGKVFPVFRIVSYRFYA